MRIVLLYAPPWKIARNGDPLYPPEEGPPDNADPAAVTEGDFIQAPYGLLSLAAQALRSGLSVQTVNASNFTWPDIEILIRRLNADLFGLSCMTENRRGVAMVARLIRNIHPGSHIVVGGPHVTALPIETLRHVRAIDTVVVGEGEDTFLDIIRCLRENHPVQDIPGTAWRTSNGFRIGPPRARIADLDTLAPPSDYFDLHTLLTSRGCPMQCTFCSSKMMWGKKVRFHSAAYVLNMLETAVNRRGQRILSIKDDTFTADRPRALAICKGIRKRRLEFIWSCDTRADYLDEVLLSEMRQSGCTRISMGVESASTAILRNINKRLSLDRLFDVTRAAKKYGIQTRYYMMAGNRGETLETFQQSLDFLTSAKPNQFVFSQLHLYPGTEVFDIYMRHGLVSPEIFFTSNFFCLTCFAGNKEDEIRIRKSLSTISGVQNCWQYGVADYLAALTRMPEMHLLHVDLCRAYLQEGNSDAAERHLRRAIELGFFLPGIVHNLYACIAAARMDIERTRFHLYEALAIHPHQVVIENIERLEFWLNSCDTYNNTPLKLAPGDGFESTIICRQPECPDSSFTDYKFARSP
ncbi:MAG: radical SAM protein [Desulfatirhabdiaceae bacterium]|nr:radical SAM protein [Desulfatirhabdiaceae bacterium]